MKLTIVEKNLLSWTAMHIDFVMCKKAGEDLKFFTLKCSTRHAWHTFCIRAKYAAVDELIAAVKGATVKNRARRNQFLEEQLRPVGAKRKNCYSQRGFAPGTH